MEKHRFDIPSLLLTIGSFSLAEALKPFLQGCSVLPLLRPFSLHTQSSRGTTWNSCRCGGSTSGPGQEWIKDLFPENTIGGFHLEEDLLEKEEEYLRLLRGDLDLLDPLLLLLDPLE